jgi:hypothetical protein
MLEFHLTGKIVLATVSIFFFLAAASASSRNQRIAASSCGSPSSKSVMLTVSDDISVMLGRTTAANAFAHA